MSAYNLKVVEYNGYIQFRIYSKPIFVEDDKTDIKDLKNEIYYMKETYGWIDESKKKVKKIKKKDSEDSERSKKVSINRTIQTIYDYTLNNEWDWFVTLTFNGEKIDRYDYKLIMDKTRNWLDNTRKRKAKDLKYILVPEKHKDGAFHVHALFANCGNLEFTDSGRVAVGEKAYIRTADNAGQSWIYNINSWKLGWSTATKVKSSVKCASYVTKYITKELCIELKNYRRFYPSNNLNKSVKTTYNMPIEDIQEWISQYEVDYVKSQRIPEAGQLIKYITVKVE